jgi:hypothetical protein
MSGKNLSSNDLLNFHVSHGIPYAGQLAPQFQALSARLSRRGYSSLLPNDDLDLTRRKLPVARVAV